MRYLLALILPVALAARTGPTSGEKGNQGETVDSIQEKTWVLAEGSIEHYVSNTVDQNESHLFKLECLGCPFRREEEVLLGVDNSLLLNFTIVRSESSILINGEHIWPLASSPPSITAFQVPTDIPDDAYIQLAHMLDRYGRPRDTKYGQIEIGYKYTQLATSQPGVEWLQFDITELYIRQEHQMLGYHMDKEDQKMFQLSVHRPIQGNEKTVTFGPVRTIQRGEKEAPLKMPCGRDAMLVAEYNPAEWDEFGKIGSWSHMWNSWFSDSWFARNWLNIHFAVTLLAICILIRRRRLQRMEQAAAMRAEEDAEAALLDCDDTPPEYIQETGIARSLEHGGVFEEEKAKYQL